MTATDRLDYVGDRGLRRHTARGALINVGFLAGASALNLVRGFALAAFLTAADYGLYGIVFVTIIVLLFFKQVGIGDKYVQQDEADQELAFQKAFTLEAIVCAIGTVLVLATAPLAALAWGDDRLLAATLAFAFVVPAWALQMPILVLYRQMRYGRQAVLQAIEPVVTTVVSLALAIAGAGYWALIGGMLAGAWTAAAVAIITSPYKLRLRYERGTARGYWTFSWPLFVHAAGSMVVMASALIGARIHLGLAGAGIVTLAANISAFTARLDALMTQTLYPAICAAADRIEILHETFVKSNRIALMWAMPFGFGLTLFADDLVTYVLGPERWADAVVLLQVSGVTAALGQSGMHWGAYYRARGETRPLAVTSIGTTIAFVVSALPLLFIFDLTGYAIGLTCQVGVALVFRGFYLARLFAGFSFVAHIFRALVPVVPAAAVVLALRAVLDERSLALAIGELGLFVAICAVLTVHFERRLIGEAAGYAGAGS